MGWLTMAIAPSGLSSESSPLRNSNVNSSAGSAPPVKTSWTMKSYLGES